MIRRARRGEAPRIAPIAQGGLADLLPLLRCPRTGSELEPGEDGSLVADGGRRSYPVVGGVPILIDDERSLVDVRWALEGRDLSAHATTSASGLRPLLERALRRFPTSDRNVAADRNCRRLVELLRVRAASGRRPRLLVLAGRMPGSGSEQLLDCSEVEVIEADLVFGPRTNIVCDSHDLPFAKGAFDAVLIQSVIDHVLDPQRVASEVHRVLADDGLVYSEVGFMQQVHAGAFDFNRFTHLGHRRLWRYFNEVYSGAQCGPGMALLWSTEYFLRAFAGESAPLRAVVARAVALAGFWVKYLDHLLVRLPGGVDAASGTFFLGSRRETPVPDRVIVASFRGILPGGQRLPPPRPAPAPDDEIHATRGIRIRRRERTAPGV